MDPGDPRGSELWGDANGDIGRDAPVDGNSGSNPKAPPAQGSAAGGQAGQPSTQVTGSASPNGGIMDPGDPRSAEFWGDANGDIGRGGEAPDLPGKP